MYKHFFKRVIDICVSFIGLLLFLPLFFLLIIGLKIKQGGVFFLQNRPGKNGKVFKIVKLKTMTDERDLNGDLLPDKERLTKIGKFVRATSLDEIPQLINVFIGDMSLVGPRPLLIKYLPIYNEEQNRRHLVKPGVSGWAQVNGRNDISWSKKFELDIWYVDNVGFLLDCKILLITIKKVLFKEGVSKVGHATTETFNGYN
jgi:undecaprenyl phosphate N,N'-diacetylbacillosamine 1-phosphate transferase